jgi:hypothetical protein
VLDFYVLVDKMTDWPGGKLRAWAGSRLPPNVEYRDWPDLGVRAKVAVIAFEDFEKGVKPSSLDTTLWARFAQPCALAAARDPAAAAAVRKAVTQAVATAAGWAAALGPASGQAADYWGALFAETYAAELRVEKTGRGNTLLDFAGPRYAAILPEAWAALRLHFEIDGKRLTPGLSGEERRRAWNEWRLRKAFGKPLNMARLLKAAFTFEGASEYIAWKVERHSGYRLPLTPWNKRHPFLSAPGALWRLWRAGVLK